MHSPHTRRAGNNKFPLTHLEKLLQCLQGGKHCPRLYLTYVCHQVRIKPGDEHKTAITTRFGTIRVAGPSIRAGWCSECLPASYEWHTATPCPSFFSFLFFSFSFFFFFFSKARHVTAKTRKRRIELSLLPFLTPSSLFPRDPASCTRVIALSSSCSETNTRCGSIFVCSLHSESNRGRTLHLGCPLRPDSCQCSSVWGASRLSCGTRWWEWRAGRSGR